MNIQVDLHMNCSYTNQLIRQVLEEQGELFQFNPTGDECHQLYWLEYEDLDFDLLYHSAKQQTKEKKILANSFCIRKGLLRKANFAAFIQQYLAKVRTNEYELCGKISLFVYLFILFARNRIQSYVLII